MFGSLLLKYFSLPAWYDESTEEVRSYGFSCTMKLMAQSDNCPILNDWITRIPVIVSTILYTAVQLLWLLSSEGK